MWIVSSMRVPFIALPQHLYDQAIIAYASIRVPPSIRVPSIRLSSALNPIDIVLVRILFCALVCFHSISEGLLDRCDGRFRSFYMKNIVYSFRPFGIGKKRITFHGNLFSLLYPLAPIPSILSPHSYLLAPIFSTLRS